MRHHVRFYVLYHVVPYRNATEMLKSTRALRQTRPFASLGRRSATPPMSGARSAALEGFAKKSRNDPSDPESNRTVSS